MVYRAIKRCCFIETLACNRFSIQFTPVTGQLNRNNWVINCSIHNSWKVGTKLNFIKTNRTLPVETHLFFFVFNVVTYVLFCQTWICERACQWDSVPSEMKLMFIFFFRLQDQGLACQNKHLHKDSSQRRGARFHCNGTQGGCGDGQT